MHYLVLESVTVHERDIYIISNFSSMPSLKLYFNFCFQWKKNDILKGHLWNLQYAQLYVYWEIYIYKQPKNALFIEIKEIHEDDKNEYFKIY